MSDYINELRMKSLDGDSDAQIILFSKLYWDLCEKDEAIQMCGNLRSSNCFFSGVYEYLNLSEKSDHGFMSSLVWNNHSPIAFPIFNSMANSEKDNLEICFIWVMLGLCYIEGCGVEKDTQQARLWFKKSASRGNAFGHYMLGRSYMTNREFKLAITEFENAANMDIEQAMLCLGEIYAYKLKDYDNAYHWYMKAKTSKRFIPIYVNDILSTGHIDWSICNHQYWPSLKIELVEKKYICGSRTSKIIAVIDFKQQVQILLLISKFRRLSSLKYVHIFSKGIACTVLKHLAKSWVI